MIGEENVMVEERKPSKEAQRKMATLAALQKMKQVGRFRVMVLLIYGREP